MSGPNSGGSDQRVFISYASQDKHAADAVCATLESKSIRCWIAPRDILPGTEWAQSIIDGIAGSALMLLVFSEHANASPQVRKEVERAVHRGMPIIPLRIEDVLPSGSMEYFLSTPHWLDAMTPPLERHLDQVAEMVRLVLLQIKNPGQPLPEMPRAQVNSNRRRPWLVISAAIIAPLFVGILAVILVNHFSHNQNQPIPASIAQITPPAPLPAAASQPAATQSSDQPVPQNPTPDNSNNNNSEASKLNDQGWQDVDAFHLDRALSEFNRCLLLDGHLADAYAGRCNVYLLQGDDNNDNAIAQSALQALQYDRVAPFNHAMHAMSVFFTAARPDYAAIRSDMENGIAVDPKCTMVDLALSRARWQLGDYDGAQNALNDALQMDPQNYMVFWQSAWLYDAQMQYDKALIFCQKAISLVPDWYEPHRLRAEALFGKGLIADARTEIAEAERLSPHNSDVLLTKSKIVGPTDLNAATEANQQARVLVPNQPGPYVQFAVLLASQNQWNDAIDTANRAIEIDSQCNARYVLAENAYRTGDLNQAATLAEQTFSQNPGDIGLLAFSAHIYEDQHRFPAALRVLSEFVHDSNGCPEALYARAVLYIKMRRTDPDTQHCLDLALADINSLMGTYKTPAALIERAGLYIARDQWALATDDANAVLNLIPDDPRALARLGFCQFHTGDFDDAIQNLNAAIKARPQEAGYYVFRGDLYQAENDDPNAQRNFAMAKKLQFSDCPEWW